MSELEKFDKALPLSEEALIKLPVDTEVYTIISSRTSRNQVYSLKNTIFCSYKEPKYPIIHPLTLLWDKVKEDIRKFLYPTELLAQGIKIEVLEPNKQWKKGTLKARLVFEFIPDEPEIVETPENPLDELNRKLKESMY